MKKLTKIMTAAGCALLIGGGLSLYAAADTSAPQTRAASEGGPAILTLFADSWPYCYNWVYNDGVTVFSRTDLDNGVLFAYNYNSATTISESFELGSGSILLKDSDGETINELSASSASISNLIESFGGTGTALSFTSMVSDLGSGSYTLEVPQGFFITESGPNAPFNFNFTVANNAVEFYLSNLESRYVSPEDLQNGIINFRNTYPNPNDAILRPINPEQAFQVTVTPPDSEPITTTYGSSCLTITEGEFFTLPAVFYGIELPAADANNIPNGSEIVITFPAGWYKGVTESNVIYTNKRFKSTSDIIIWTGMTQPARTTEEYNYVPTVPEIEITWAGQKVTLTEKYAATNTVPITINYMYECNVACEITPNGNLKLTGLPAAIDEYFKESPYPENRISIGIPEGIVQNEKGQVNLAAYDVCSFSILEESAEVNPTLTFDPETGVVTMAWTQDNIDYIEFLEYEPIQVMQGEKSVMSVSRYDLNREDNNIYTFSIASLLPNQEYTVVIDAYSIKVSTNGWQNEYANTKVTLPVKYNVTVTESGELGEGEIITGWGSLELWYPYNDNMLDIYKGSNTFKLGWKQDGVAVPVNVLDPSKITGYVKVSWDDSGWDKITNVQVKKDNEWTNDITITLPPEYATVYNEYKFILEDGLVYVKSDEGVLSNAAQTITYSTYGQFNEDNITLVPSPTTGSVTITPDKLKTVEIEFKLNDGEEVVDFKLGTDAIQITNSGYQAYYTVQESDITLEDGKLILDLSGFNWQNEVYTLLFRTNSLQVTTNFDNNWFIYWTTIQYNVWAGLPDAVATGPDGKLSRATIESASFDGIYTLDWGEKVTPTENFSLNYSVEVAETTTDSEGNEKTDYRQRTFAVDKEYISFLTAEGQLATFEEGGDKMVINATKLIQESLEPEYSTYFNLIIEKGSVQGAGGATIINPRQQIAYISIAEVAETTAEISGPADGIITIAWDPNLYRIASHNAQKIEKGIELYDSENNLIGSYTFEAPIIGSVTPQPEGYPLQFLMHEDKSNTAYGFTLDLNEIGLYGSDDYTVVLPEGSVLIVTIADVSNSGYQAPINPKQEYTFSFESYGLYEGNVEITPLPGGTVEELYDVTITFVDAQEINLVGTVYVNDQPLTASDFNIVNNSLTIINPLVDEEEITIFIEAGAIVIDGKFINEEIKESYTISSESDAIAGIEAVDGRYEVYTIAGVHVLSTEKASALNTLANGLYIINGKKVYIRK